MADCMVCGKETTKCPPSPFLPYSGWRCDECQKAKRIPYQDLVGCYPSRQVYNDMGPGLYFDRYMIPTLEYFGKTIEDVEADVKVAKNLVFLRPSEDI